MEAGGNGAFFGKNLFDIDETFSKSSIVPNRGGGVYLLPENERCLFIHNNIRVHSTGCGKLRHPGLQQSELHYVG